MRVSATKTFAFIASGLLLTTSMTPVFAGHKGVALTNEYIHRLGTTEYPEGGIWFHQVSVSGNTKSVVSNYQHNSKQHKASCDIGGENKDSSGWQEAGDEARSSTSGPKEWGTAHAYYDTK